MEFPLRIAICEDLDADAILLTDLIKKSGQPSEYERFISGEEFMQSFMAGRYDLVFMDIYMGGMLGIDVARAIRAADNEVVIAFITNSLDHALESYRLGALKYIEKPVTMKDVDETLEIALLKRKPKASVNILIGGKYTDIPLDNIRYFEQRDHVVEIYTLDHVLRASQTVRMNHIEKWLSSPNFVRCHHSFIVNLRYVQGIDMDYKFFVMNGDGARVYIRHNLLKKMKTVYEDYIFAATRGNK